MPYYSGSAASAADIVTAVRNACVLEGWTLTNDILSKGTCFTRFWSPGAGFVSVVSGRGQTGGGGSTLTGQSNASLVGVGGTMCGIPFTFPMDYHIHIHAAPDEVYVFLNYGGSSYQRLMFGQSNVQGLVGTGNFYDASRQSSPTTLAGAGPDLRLPLGTGSTSFRPYPFQNFTGFVGGDSGLDHSMTTDPEWRNVRFTPFSFPLHMNSPNAWNGESILIPAQAYVSMAGFYALVAELVHMRFVSMDNLDPQQILTLGADQWKVYPCWRKGTRANFNAGSENSLPDSSTYGVAIRYDGP